MIVRTLSHYTVYAEVRRKGERIGSRIFDLVPDRQTSIKAIAPHGSVTETPVIGQRD